MKRPHYSLVTVILGVTLLTSACGRRCQAPEAASFRSVVETPWRLVESNDPQVAKELDNFNFLILQFNRNNTGDVKRVVDNDQYDSPVMTLVWVPDGVTKVMRIQYSSVSSEAFDSVDDVGAAGSGDQGTYDYSYKLGRQLEMNEKGRGYYYRYVPFKGIVDPDNVCEF